MTIITFCFIEGRHICPLFNSTILAAEARIGFVKSFFDIRDVWTNLGAHVWSFTDTEDYIRLTRLQRHEWPIITHSEGTAGPLASLAPPLASLSAFLVDVQLVNACASPLGAQGLTLVKERHKTLVQFEEAKMVLLGFFSLLYWLNVAET